MSSDTGNGLNNFNAMYGIEWEYNHLRAEIIKRIELRQQMSAITLTLAGVFLSVGLTNQLVLLVYPVLAMFLAFGLAQNDYRIRELAKYIRENIEIKIPDLNYESHAHEKRIEGGGHLGSWRIIILSYGGIFLLTQLMAIGIALLKLTFNILSLSLLGIDIITILVVIWIIMCSAQK